MDEFNTIDLEEEQDPPCFTEARQKQKQQQLNEIEGMHIKFSFQLPTQGLSLDVKNELSFSSI